MDDERHRRAAEPAPLLGRGAPRGPDFDPISVPTPYETCCFLRILLQKGDPDRGLYKLRKWMMKGVGRAAEPAPGRGPNEKN